MITLIILTFVNLILTILSYRFNRQTKIQNQSLADELKVDLPIEGDGKAVFLSDPTETEVEEYEMKVERGWEKFYDKLKNLW